MIGIKDDPFPLSRTKKIKGYRKLARIKVLQILTAYELSGIDWQHSFSHIFFRDFNLGEDKDLELQIDEDVELVKVDNSDETEPVQKDEKILSPEEVYELEADTPIEWNQEEIEFARKLIDRSLNYKDYINNIIKESTANWELDRITVIDRILMYMAAAEMISFPDIPLKVSINEAIDIAKDFSTEKSNAFINGLLDTILNKLKEEDRIHKSERGLKEN